MKDATEKLKAAYDRSTDSDLIKAFTIDRDKYEDIALTVIGQEIEKRKLKIHETEDKNALVILEKNHIEPCNVYSSKYTIPLIVFMIYLPIVSFANIYFSLSQFIRTEPPKPISFEFWLFVGFAFVGMYGFLCLWLLIKRKIEAPKNAKIWLILDFLIRLLGAGSLQNYIYCAIPIAWIVYLSKSKKLRGIFSK